MKVLSIFNHYRERGGEAAAVNAICRSLKEVAEVEQCEFLSADWSGKNAPTPWKQAWWMLRNPASLKLPRLATMGNEKRASRQPPPVFQRGPQLPDRLM